MMLFPLSILALLKVFKILFKVLSDHTIELIVWLEPSTFEANWEAGFPVVSKHGTNADFVVHSEPEV